jgi:hypothetical protein
VPTGPEADVYLRDGERLAVDVKVREGRTGTPRLAAAVSARNLIPQLGVFVLDLDDALAAELGQTRGQGGVPVAAELAQVPTLGEDLQVDDIVYNMNRQRVTGAERLRELLKGPTPRGAGRLPGRAQWGAPLRLDGAALKLSRNPGRSIQSRQGTGTQLRRGKWSL